MVSHRQKITLSIDPDILSWLEKQSEIEDRAKGRIVERLLREYKQKLEEEK